MKTLFDDEPRFASYGTDVYKFDGSRIYRASPGRTTWVPMCSYSNFEFGNLLRSKGVQEVYEDPIRR